MRDRTALFARWRASVGGAWLAMAHALAVLTAALALPAQAAPAPVGERVILCSGEMLAGGAAGDVGERDAHCQGCPAMPIAAMPPPPVFVFAPARQSASERPLLPNGILAHGFPFGLANPRAPPVS